MAQNGKAVRISDAYSDVRFSKVDNCTNIITKTMMCVPVPGLKEENLPTAMIQVLLLLEIKILANVNKPLSFFKSIFS